MRTPGCRAFDRVVPGLAVLSSYWTDDQAGQPMRGRECMFNGIREMNRGLDHLYIFATILLTVYSQLVMRWQVGVAGEVPADLAGKMRFIGQLLISPWVLTGLFATFMSGVSWMLAMTRFDIGYAYPFISLNYVLVMAAGFLIFHESLNLAKIIGTAFVIVGIIIVSRG